MKNKKLNIIIIIIAILVVIALVIAIEISKKRNESKSVKAGDSEEVVEEKNANGVTEKISGLSEEDRIKTYVGEFISNIENEDYSIAYNSLNDSFKQNYFKDEETFENYVKQKYPSDMNIDYSSVKRQGEIYIVTTKISDLFDKNVAEFEQRFIVRENGANDYKISFDVQQ